MTTYTFSKLESDIMKVLTKNPGLFLSQYKIYDQILENYEIKDPIEKDNITHLRTIRRFATFIDKSLYVLNINKDIEGSVT